MTRDLEVKTTNRYDNTTINQFNVTISNSTFQQLRNTTNGTVIFDHLGPGLYTINISSEENGGYFNQSLLNQNFSENIEGRLYQAIVYFTAVRRGTSVAVLDYNLSAPLATNVSNSTGGTRLFLNTSDQKISIKSEDYFDNFIQLNLTNKSTNRAVAEFYDINVSIALFSILNNTFVNGFTIELTGTNFTETRNDEIKGNASFSLGNNTYTIIASHPDFTTTQFIFTITSDSTYPNLTFSILGANSINFSVFDEITEKLLPENASITIIGDNFAGNFTTLTGLLHVQDILPGDYRVRTTANKYHERDFYFVLQNDSNQTIDLYLLSTTNGTEVTFTVQDNSGNELTNATIRLKRYYVSTNSYRTIAMSRTNEEGETIIDVDFNDAFYETFTTTPDNFSLRTIGARIITTTLFLTINLLADPF